MKKTIAFILASMTLVLSTTAQWKVNGSTLYYTGGGVAIGVSTAAGPLQVYGGNAYLWGLVVGVGTSLGVITSDIGSKELSFQIGSTEYARINTSGNLLLGKTSQTNTAYKLDVNGTARFNQAVVNTTGADFVFDSTYRLPSLDSTAAYIQKYRHLAGIATAADMKRDGLDLGDNQTKLLQKIEELTLYIIEQEEKLNGQEEKLKYQQQQIDELKTMVEKLVAKK